MFCCLFWENPDSSFPYIMFYTNNNAQTMPCVDPDFFPQNVRTFFTQLHGSACFHRHPFKLRHGAFCLIQQQLISECTLLKNGINFLTVSLKKPWQTIKTSGT